MHCVDWTGRAHVTFKLLVSGSKVKPKNQHSAGALWIFVFVTVGPKFLSTTTLLALSESFVLLDGHEHPSASTSSTLTLAVAAPAHCCCEWRGEGSTASDK